MVIAWYTRARHRLSKSGRGLNMWACTYCFPPNPISPDKTLFCVGGAQSSVKHSKDNAIIIGFGVKDLATNKH